MKGPHDRLPNRRIAGIGEVSVRLTAPTSRRRSRSRSCIAGKFRCAGASSAARSDGPPPSDRRRTDYPARRSDAFLLAAGKLPAGNHREFRLPPCRNRLNQRQDAARSTARARPDRWLSSRFSGWLPARQGNRTEHKWRGDYGRKERLKAAGMARTGRSVTDWAPQTRGFRGLAGIP